MIYSDELTKPINEGETKEEVVLILKIELGVQTDEFEVLLYKRNRDVMVHKFKLPYNYSLTPLDFKDTKELRQFIHLCSLKYNLNTVQLLFNAKEPYTCLNENDMGYFIGGKNSEIPISRYGEIKEELMGVKKHFEAIYVGENSVLDNPIEIVTVTFNVIL